MMRYDTVAQRTSTPPSKKKPLFLQRLFSWVLAFVGTGSISRSLREDRHFIHRTRSGIWPFKSASGVVCLSLPVR
jgi:hypothetical protein